MADDDKGVKEGQVPADPPAVEPSAQTFKQASAPRPPDPASEWTVSDTRGPLSTAHEDATDKDATDKDATGKEATNKEATNKDATAAASADPAPMPAPVSVASKPEAVQASEPDASRKSEEPRDLGSSRKPEDPTAPKPPTGPEARDETDATKTPPRIVHEVKRPLLPIAAGIVIGAAIGAGSAAFVYRSVQNDVMPEEVTRLSARVDALEKRPQAAPDAQAADKQAGLATLKQTVADLESRVAGLGKTGGKPEAAAPPDLGPLQARVGALQAGLDALKDRVGDSKGLDAKLARLESTVAGMKSDASSAKAGVAAVQGEQKQLAGKVAVPALAVVADSLVQQIAQGQPYANQVEALAALGADATKLAVLRQNAGTGVPSAKVLATKFEPLAEPLLSTAHHAPPNAGFFERMKSGMLGLVSVRRADDLSGNDPASRVAHIKSDLAHDDVAAALVVWDGLPAEAKAKGAAWHALAQSHAEAMRAARGLQQEAIAALGGKKS